MSRPTILQGDFGAGMKRDFSRDDMPSNSCWNLTDYIPDEIGSPLRKRGGYTYSSPDLTTVSATAAKVEGVFYAPFAAGDQLVAVDEDGRVFQIVSSTTANDKGLAVRTRSMSFHRDLLVIGATDGTSAPRKYGGSAAPAPLAGSPPAGAKYVATYKDRTVLAAPASQPQRVYFSGAGNPESWDTINSYIDASSAIVGLAALQNALLVFTQHGIERIRGSVPPSSTTTGDMSMDILHRTTCADNRTIAYLQDNVLFVGNDGVYVTDGAATRELSAACGMRSYVVDEIGTALASGRSMAGGTYQGYYVFGAALNDLVFLMNPIKNVAFIFQNIDANMFTASSGPSESKLYFGREGAARVGEFSSCFDPSASVKTDADGTAVTPVVETPFYYFRPGEKRWRNIYLSYGLSGDPADAPSLTVSAIDSPQATSYRALAPSLSNIETGSFSWGTGVWGTGVWGAEATGRDRRRIPVTATSEGLGFKIAQTNASSDTRVYALEADLHQKEPSRLAQ